MTPFLELMLVLALIVAGAKLVGYLVGMLGQPTVVGEIAFGLIIGPSVLNVLGMPIFTHAAETGETIKLLGELGVVLSVADVRLALYRLGPRVFGARGRAVVVVVVVVVHLASSRAMSGVRAAGASGRACGLRKSSVRPRVSSVRRIDSSASAVAVRARRASMVSGTTMAWLST